jgi:amino acid adenylation domain-containing protein
LKRPADPAVRPSLVDCFVEAARRFPQRTAVRAGERTVAYRELDERSARLAGHLMRLGVGAEMHVGLRLSRGIAAVVGLLGILRAGAAYLPLDPQAPPSLVADAIAEAGVHVVLVDRGSAGAAGVTPVELDADGRLDTPADLPAALPAIGPDQLMYTIYTSGSSGGAKGVLVDHGQVARLFPALAEHVRFDENDVWSQTHSLAFGFSVWEIWGALAHGGTLLVVAQHVALAPARLFPLLAAHSVTVLSLTPSAFRVLVRSGRALPQPSALQSLRMLAFSGEPLDAAILDAWFDRFGDERPLLANMYALTETAGEVAYRRVRRGDRAGAARHSIGRPLPDTSFRLVDSAGMAVADGAAGELIVVGPSVARGYLNRPDLQAQRFIDEGAGGPVATRGYRTGDLARRLADGEYEFVGRADRQLKVRGYRVEPAQIEDVLRQHGSVVDAVVGGDPYGLFAAVVVRDGRLPDGLPEFVAARLPHYCVPDRWAAIDRLPLTMNGKLDLGAVQSAGGGRAAAETIVDGSDGPADALRVIWRELLGVDELGDDDDFFDRGGHSLLTLQLIQRIEERLGRTLTMRDVFERPVFSAQVDLLRRLAPQRALLLESPPASGAAIDSSSTAADGSYMARAIAEARRALDAGEAPYAACIVRGDSILACAHNRVAGRADITAHAEIEAIRAACAALGSTDLSGCTLYSTCEPCSMCLTACAWAKIGRVVWGARMSDEQRFGLAAPTVPAATMRAQLGRPAELVADLRRDEMLALFELWFRMQAV